MTSSEIIFESYNRVVERSYDRAFEESGKDDPLKVRESNVSRFLDEEIGTWETTPLTEMEGLTPKEYFGRLAHFDDVVEHVKIGAKMCDRGLPELLVDKLMSYGNRAVDALFQMASDRDMLENEDDIYISLIAVRILGERRVSAANNFLVELIKTLNEDKELMVEEITDALINIGEPCVGVLISELDKSEEIGYIHEYLLTALVKIGKERKTDEIYRCIKNTFLKMDDKILGAMCVGDYGDGRAIPALKGYVKKNAGKLDKQTFLEIKAAVKRLGGIVEDMDGDFA
ncbi:hypothetical protein V6C42_06785 [Pseudoclostridium thermosuccinogenes]|uniref:hypothetical protein n=1 Tax=Clostridium thermosuccinogenes TaxID=84032 RepID=UPI002FDB45D9